MSRSKKPAGHAVKKIGKGWDTGRRRQGQQSKDLRRSRYEESAADADSFDARHGTGSYEGPRDG